MRLSDVLSKPYSSKFVQVDGFINKTISTGSQQKIDIGRIGLNFHCNNCDDARTFWSSNKIYCIGVNSRQISIDCVLQCECKMALVAVWFLVESYDDIAGMAPQVRILKRREKLSERARLVVKQYPDYAEMLDKAERAYRDGLGAGSVVYLRKIFEKIASNIAGTANISCQNSTGKRKPFKLLLEEVDKQCAIIPIEYSANGYKLFGELSDLVHDDSVEQVGIQKYESLRRLVIGILDNVSNKSEIRSAIGSLGWNKDGGKGND